MTTPRDDQERGEPDGSQRKSDLLYGVEERPPWYLWVLLSFQQFLMSVTSYIPNPLIIAAPLCISADVVGLGDFVGTVFFVGGISSLLQTTLGARLPIIQGPSSTFISPIMMMMSTSSRQCPDFNNPGNITLPFEPASEEHRAFWKSNLCEVQGALMVASLLEVILGFSGLIGVLMRYIGPLTTGTVLTLIGLSLTTVASNKGSTHWWICFATIFLIVIFSQYLRNITMPFFGGQRLRIFLLFPVLLGMGVTWLICLILTETDVLPDRKGEWGYEARTDIKVDAIRNASRFRFPYPGQWGTPTISAGGVIAIMAAIIASTIESVGDYHACARLCYVPSPPGSAISRGIGMEGIGCILGGAWGTGSGFTSYSHNIASIGLTKVGSRIVIQGAAFIMIIVGCLGKVGAFFSIVPDPIVGGMIYAMIGMITAVGVSNLGLTDLNSTRNLFVFGFSVFFGVSAPAWVAKNGIDVGNETANQVLTAFCSTSMLVGGVISFLLDNTIPGTLEERGIVLTHTDQDIPVYTDISAYNMPLIQPFINKVRCFRFVPFCPGFIKDNEKPNLSSDHDQSLSDIEVKVDISTWPEVNKSNGIEKDEKVMGSEANKTMNGIDNGGFTHIELTAEKPMGSEANKANGIGNGGCTHM